MGDKNSGSGSGGRHQDKTERNGHKQGGGSGKYGSGDSGGKHTKK